MNISQTLWSKERRVESASAPPLPSSSSHFYVQTELQKRESEQWQFGQSGSEWVVLCDLLRGVTGCWVCVSSCCQGSPALLRSAPALTVESVSPPNDVCGAQLIPLCPHLQGERERERERFTNGAVCELLMQKYDTSRARSRSNRRGITGEVHWHHW